MGLTSIDKITLTMTPPTITDTGNSKRHRAFARAARRLRDSSLPVDRTAPWRRVDGLAAGQTRRNRPADWAERRTNSRAVRRTRTGRTAWDWLPPGRWRSWGRSAVGCIGLLPATLTTPERRQRGTPAARDGLEGRRLLLRPGREGSSEAAASAATVPPSGFTPCCATGGEKPAPPSSCLQEQADTGSADIRCAWSPGRRHRTGACPDWPGRAIGATPTMVPLSLLDIIPGPPGGAPAWTAADQRAPGPGARRPRGAQGPAMRARPV